MSFIRFFGFCLSTVLFLSACGGDEAPSSGEAAAQQQTTAGAESKKPARGTEPLANDLRQAIRDVLGPIYKGIDSVRYMASATDLNADGRPEIVVYPMGPMVCGSGGCDLLVLAKEKGRYRLKSRTSVVQTPIFLSDQRHEGWSDLIVTVGGGGVVGEPLRRIRLNNGRYTANASLAESVRADQRGPLLLAAGVSAQKARPLAASEDVTLSDQQRYAGRYRGVLPCASCPGIETELALKSDGRFELLQVYKEEESEPFITLGQWQAKEGADSVFELLSDDQNDEPRYFELDDSGATALDRKGQRIEADYSLRLERVSGE